MRYIIFLLLFLPFISQAVVINEIAWMGTETSANDEWIELYNNSEQDINLEGWALYEDETLIEPLSGIIKANSYYLIERTDDETVPNIPASQEPSGWAGHGLNNKGENLQLLDNNSNLIDQVNCKDGWFAGDNKTKQTMERTSPDSSIWQSSQNPGGTPKAQNSHGATKLIESTETEPAGAGLLQTYSGGIVFNEILPSPEGPDAENEWIEIFNQNDFEINLSGWKIKDTEGKTTTYTFPKGTKISSKGYLVLSRPETKITLNNTNDGLNLIQPNGEIIDSVDYKKAPKGQSYNRTESDWSWKSNLSPGKENNKSIQQQTKTKKLTEEGPLLVGSAVMGEKPAKEASQYISKSRFSIFLIAFFLSIFSGIIVLILKKKFPEETNY